jgi:predicted phage terminase large subunit-like protein
MMIRALLLMSSALLVGSAVTAKDDPALIAGVFDPPRLAPDFSLRGSDGSELKLSRYRGKVVLMAFGYSSCEAVCPITLGVLAQARKKLDAAAGQLQQRPSPAGGGIFKRHWWKIWDDAAAIAQGVTPGNYPPMEYVIGVLDTAYTEKQENDYSAMTVWGLWRDRKGLSRLMLMFGWHERLALNDLVTKVIGTCRKHRVDRLLIEAKASGQSAAQEIRRLMYDEIRSRTVSPMPTTAAFGIELINPRGGDKVARAHSVTALFEEGLIWAPGFDDGTFRDWAELVVAECAVFPKGAHDDLVDSVTQAIRYLRNVGLAERPIERETRIKEKLMFKGRSSSQPLYPA